MRATWLLALGIAFAIAPIQGVKTIAVSSVEIPREFRRLPRPRARFDSLISSTLRTKGFAVVPWEVSESIWLRLRDSIGGYYDTYTGKLIKAKVEAVHMGMLRELHARYAVDAWLHSWIDVVSAPFTGGKVKWHGAEQESGARGGLGGFLFGTKKGSIRALSLYVALEDTVGTELYEGVGGIELGSQIEGGRFVDITPGLLLVDEARNATAVHLALDPLPTRLTSRPGP
jgi:hypothetical protein